MKKNIIIERTCIVCRQKQDRSNMIKIVRNKNGEIAVDKTGKNEGRGCYVCASDECLSKFFKTRALNRAFKTNISEEIYDQIRNDFK